MQFVLRQHATLGVKDDVSCREHAFHHVPNLNTEFDRIDRNTLFTLKVVLFFSHPILQSSPSLGQSPKVNF